MSNPRVSFDKPESRSNSITGKSENEPLNRSNSVNRRASLPVPRASIGEKPPVQVAVTDSTSSSEQTPSRRASVATGMLSAPYQKTTKEAPRWRPYTFEAQQSKNNADGSRQVPSLSQVEEAAKPLAQRILEKGAVSFALECFILIVCYVIGSVLKIILRRDFGLLAFWLNQAFILFLFCVDKRPEEEERKQRMDKFTAFELLTLGCQAVPVLYTYATGGVLLYSGLLTMVGLQTLFKFGLMFFFGKVVEISL